jgi:hypothetical protein
VKTAREKEVNNQLFPSSFTFLDLISNRRYSGMTMNKKFSR